jgi:hypothetical protein
MSADPYVASGGAADPGSWNRYSYVSGDPVNFNYPEGLQEGPPQRSCIINGVWWPEAYCDVVLRQRPARQMTEFDRDRNALQAALDTLASRTSFSQNCLDGFAGLGISPWDLVAGAGDLNIENGAISNTSIRDAYGRTGDPARVGNAAQAGLNRTHSAYLRANNISDMRVPDTLAVNTRQTAYTPWGGNTLYVDSNRLDTSRTATNQGLVMHELIHNLFGTGDGVIQSRLGLPSGASVNITTWLTANCVNGRDNR